MQLLSIARRINKELKFLIRTKILNLIFHKSYFILTIMRINHLHVEYERKTTDIITDICNITEFCNI